MQHLDAECVLYGEIASLDLSCANRAEPGRSVGGGEDSRAQFELFLSGNMLTIAPPSVIRMAIVTKVTLLLILIFYKELLVTSFDSGLPSSLGINSTVMHYALMGMLSYLIVSAFEVVVRFSYAADRPEPRRRCSCTGCLRCLC